MIPCLQFSCLVSEKVYLIIRIIFKLDAHSKQKFKYIQKMNCFGIPYTNMILKYAASIIASLKLFECVKYGCFYLAY